MPGADRRADVDHIVSSVVSWAGTDSTIVGVALVGSWARREATMTSDVDFVVLTTDTDAFTGSADWVEDALAQPADITRTRLWGALTERKARVASGLEIEFGFVEPTWASVDPLDPGTRRVVSDGCVALHDEAGLLTRLIDEVHPKPSTAR